MFLSHIIHGFGILLLCGSAIGAPVNTTPAHAIPTGTVVMAASKDYKSSPFQTKGDKGFHPAIVVGHGAANDLQIAPMTHNPGDVKGFAPHMPTPGQGHGSEIYIGHDPVVIDAKNTKMGKDGKIEDKHLKSIMDAKQLVTEHKVAHDAHAEAAKLHNDAHDMHLKATAGHLKQQNPVDAAHHTDKAKEHAAKASAHNGEAAAHKIAEHGVKAGDPKALAVAHASAETAKESHGHAATSLEHAKAAHGQLLAAGAHQWATKADPKNAQEHADKAKEHVAIAQSHGPQHDNRPDPRKSQFDAKASHQNAVTVKQPAVKKA